MSHRVATLDLSEYLSHRVLAVVPFAYREQTDDTPPVPVPMPDHLRGGVFFTALVDLPEGRHYDHGYAFDHPSEPGWQRVVRADGGPLVEIWGHERPAPDAPEPGPDEPPLYPAGVRAITVDMALHIEPAARIDNVRGLGVAAPPGERQRYILEANIETARDVLNQPSHGLYDTLDEHPDWLRAFVEQVSVTTGQTRRVDAHEAPPEWGNGNGNGPP